MFDVRCLMFDAGMIVIMVAKSVHAGEASSRQLLYYKRSADCRLSLGSKKLGIMKYGKYIPHTESREELADVTYDIRYSYFRFQIANVAAGDA